MSDQIAIVPLARAHDRSGFCCGVGALDRYFREHVTQDIRRRLTNCFVAVERKSGTIAGYYTFSAASISAVDLPAEETRRIPRYPMLPAGLIGRLAVDTRFRGKHFGAALLADAAERAMRAEPAIFALLGEAKDEAASAFYRAYGFQPLTNKPQTLFLSLGTVRRAVLPPIST